MFRGAIIAPFIIGLIADKYFAAQKNIGCTAFDWGRGLGFPCGNGQLFQFYTLLIIYIKCICRHWRYGNSIALNQTNDRGEGIFRDSALGIIRLDSSWSGDRLYGIGGKSISIGYYFQNCSCHIFVDGYFQFSYPIRHLPKLEKDVCGEVLGLDALKILKDKNYAISLSPI